MTDENAAAKSQTGSKAEAPTFEGKVALVTGASSGIGAATARLLAARGASVVVNYHSGRTRARELVESLAAAGSRAVAIQADVTDEEQVGAMVEETESRLGSVDVLVLNAAGVSGRDLKIAPAVDTTWENVERVVQGQLKAFFHPLQAVLPGMLARERGSVVVVGAAASRRPSPGFLSIAMAKGAVEAAVKTVAREVGPRGVRVNAVGPGLILSAIGRNVPEAQRVANAQRSAVGRNGLPEDVAEVIAFLASEQASYLTGSYVLVDGGTAMV